MADLSDAARSILNVLLEEQENLARDLSPRDIASRAFGTEKVGPTKEQLGRLAFRGLVEDTPSGTYRLSHAGTVALGTESP